MIIMISSRCKGFGNWKQVWGHRSIKPISIFLYMRHTHELNWRKRRYRSKWAMLAKWARGEVLSPAALSDWYRGGITRAFTSDIHDEELSKSWRTIHFYRDSRIDFDAARHHSPCETAIIKTKKELCSNEESLQYRSSWSRGHTSAPGWMKWSGFLIYYRREESI